MASGIETALRALVAVLLTSGADVRRNSDIADEIPAAGLIQIAEGEDSTDVILSPVRYQHALTANVTVTVTAADEAARDAALDELLQLIHDAIMADRTLGAVVEDTSIEAPAFEPDEVDGAAKAAALPIQLFFTTLGSAIGPIG